MTTNVHWDNWRWWCRRCDKKWYPTPAQIEDFRPGASQGASAGQDDRVRRDPRVPRR